MPYFDMPVYPEYRLPIGLSGSSIICWPSRGGIYRLLNSHIVQRQFLGLDCRVPKFPRPEVSIEVEYPFCNQCKEYDRLKLHKLAALITIHISAYAAQNPEIL
ncbi:hypothetical protein GGI43DRAFT_131368 [Trichoderma evansii]